MMPPQEQDPRIGWFVLWRADELRSRSAKQAIVLILKERHDVECDNQSPVGGQAAFTLSSRRLRLARRGNGRVCRRHGLVPILESRSTRAPQGGEQRSARTTRFRLRIIHEYGPRAI